MTVPPVDRANVIGKTLEILTDKLNSTVIPFTTEAIIQCENVAELQEAAVMAIEARKVAENLVIGKISCLKRVLSQEPMKILKDITPMSRNYQLHQLLKMMGTDSDPIVMIDEDGSMAAVKIGDDGNLAIATKPSWVDSITLYRKFL